MSDFVWAALSGWAGVLMFASTFCLPFFMRRMRSKKPYLKRLWPHYWLGYALLAAALTHAWMSMRRGDMRGLSMAGLWLATGALFLIMWQVSVGLLLRVPEQGGRRALRRTHFWSMLLIGALLAAHIVLNRP